MKLTLTTELSTAERRKAIVNLKIHWAVYHEFFISKNEAEIAAGIDVGVEKLSLWRKTRAPCFEQARAFWNQNSDRQNSLRRVEKNSLRPAERIWREMARRSLDLFPTENAIDCFLEERGLQTLRSTADNQIGLEALTPPATPPATPRRLLWIHDVTTAIFAIGLLIG